ncbi:hypothetical protein [Microbacterium sp. 22242]|uniref:hypothetical protein n=1 Tax=Microbacterium sp. 22242 TaxID=3453896 RepID=UPI003F82841D
MSDPHQQPRPAFPPPPQGPFVPPAAPQAAAPAAPGAPVAPPAAAPVYQPPPGAFVGPAGGYPAPHPPSARPAGTPALGRFALLLALVATVALTIVAAVLSWQIGFGVSSGAELTTLVDRIAASDLSVLTPVRQIVLWWEITAWTATALGLWALVQGVVAIAKRRGRGPGIAALIVAAVGPVVFFLACYLTLILGVGLGSAAH